MALLGLLLCATALTVTALPAWNTTVYTNYGYVEGDTSLNGNVHVFNSIPFAQPPVGDLRFKPPVPPAKWDGVRKVTDLAHICPQLGLLHVDLLGQEDCLYLHVYVPRYDPADAKGLPVMFWIFGGGYVFGDGNEFSMYDGQTMAEANDVIVVTVNYRLGVFGFLALDELMTESGTTGNMALQDQTLGLKWVHENIKYFGGDPDRVAIFGESAGGFSICWHLVSQASAGLFSAAIMESGSCDSPQFFQSLDNAVNYGEEFSNGCGCTQSGAARLECLRGKTTGEVMGCLPKPDVSRPRDFFRSVGIDDTTASNLLPALWPIMPWGPAIDGAKEGLLDLPLTLIQKGQVNKVPWMAGTNHDEGTIFTPLMPIVAPGTHFPPDEEDLEKAVEHLWDMFNTTRVDQNIATVMAAYPQGNYKDKWAWASALLRDDFFACGTRRSLRAYAKATGMPVFMYQWTYKIGGLLYDLLGNYHASELIYVFGNPFNKIVFNHDDKEMVSHMQTYWTSMARSGTPNAATRPLTWPEYNVTKGEYMDLALPLSVKTNLYGTQCDMWDHVKAAITGLPQ